MHIYHNLLDDVLEVLVYLFSCNSSGYAAQLCRLVGHLEVFIHTTDENKQFSGVHSVGAHVQSKVVADELDAAPFQLFRWAVWYATELSFVKGSNLGKLAC